jgi:CIC family chloride channel protein
VCDDRGVLGVIRLQDLKRDNDTGLGSKRLREIVGGSEFPHVHGDHALNLALERMGASRLDLLPVVSRANVHHLEGVVTLEDVLALYGVRPKESE